MSKGGSSTTTQTPQIPAWLQQALMPLLKESATNLANFNRQGQEVLQGGNYKNAQLMTPGATPGINYAGKMDPELMARYYAQKGGTR